MSAAEGAAPAFTPAGIKGDMRRQEQPDPRFWSTDLASLVAEVSGDAVLCDLVRRAWQLGWQAGLSDANRDTRTTPMTANPFHPRGGWL